MIIYVRLLDEGTDCWRPVTAEQDGERFLVLGPVPDDERWEFQPGTYVLCRKQTFQNGEGLVAYKAAE